LACFIHEADTPTAQGDAIFARAEQAAEHGTYARYATYAVIVRFANGTHHIVDTWKTTEDIAHGNVIADVFTQEERRNPTTATGSNVTVGIGLQPSGPRAIGASPASENTTMHFQVASLNPQMTGDPIGPVAFAVDQNFGLTPPRSYQVTHDVDSFSDAGNGLMVIGRTGVPVARYHVTLLDADATTDHLALTPLRDPYHNRLRELWVDATTADVREAIVQGVGDRAPLDRIRWDVKFAQTGGATYIAEERALEPIDYGRGGVLRDATITFDQLALLPSSPFRYTFGISTPVQTVHDP
jgi:hypothetical protein